MEDPEDAGEDSATGSVLESNVTRIVHNRLINIGNADPNNDPRIKELDEHFGRLSAGYRASKKMFSVEDMLVHRELLAEAQNPSGRPAFRIRHLGAEALASDGSDVGSHMRVQSTPIHEIIFSTIDQPELLRKLSTLLYEINLNIREAHTFSTTDDYCLDIFVVNGGSVEDTAGLSEAIHREITRIGGSFAAKPEDWEIDKDKLELWESIYDDPGPSRSLWYGVYQNEAVIVERLNPTKVNASSKASFLQDIQMAREVQHKNITRFVGSYARDPQFQLVTEYLPRGCLHTYMSLDGHELSLHQILKFAIDTCKGVAYLHRKGIILRHLATSNLLLFADVVKVDLGTARYSIRNETTTYDMWTAPEVILNNTYSQKSDIFSFGVVLWELATSNVPFIIFPEIPKNMNPTLSQLIQRCWDIYPSNRPELSEITTELENLLKRVEDDAADPPPSEN